jgi:hypothetical protein
MAVAHPKPQLRTDDLFFIIPRGILPRAALPEDAIPEELARFEFQSKGLAATGRYFSPFRVSAWFDWVSLSVWWRLSGFCSPALRPIAFMIRN